MLGFEVHGDHICACLNESGEVVVGSGNHEVHVEEYVVGLVDRLDDSWAEGNVVDEVAVHDIEVEPIASGVDGACGFLFDSAEISGEQ